MKMNIDKNSVHHIGQRQSKQLMHYKKKRFSDWVSERSGETVQSNKMVKHENVCKKTNKKYDYKTTLKM